MNSIDLFIIKLSGDAAYKAYVYGDWTQENTAARLASGKDELLFADSKDFTARTVQSSDGSGRVIMMQDSGDGYGNAVQLGHEAYRNGLTGTEQQQRTETIAAVLGHTGMAARIEADTNVKFGGLLGAEVEAYKDGNMKALITDAVEHYDSSGDYWKVLNDGNIAYDGKRDLYDENGRLLQQDTTGSYSESLANYMGISASEARDLMKDNGVIWNEEKGKYLDRNGNSLNGRTDIQFETSDNFKARYDFQMNYVDKVSSDYGGSMVSALHSYVSKKLEGYTFDTPLDNYNIATAMMQGSEYYDFATAYDGAVSKYGSAGSKNDRSKEFTQMADDFDAGNYTDSNSLYKLGKDSINPLVGDSIISTYSTYDSDIPKTNIKKGDLHTKAENSLAIDWYTYGNGSPVVTTENETFVTNSSLGYTPGGGYNISTYTDLFTKTFKHLQHDSLAYEMLRNLNTSAASSSVYRFNLPTGYQLGNVGTSGDVGKSWYGIHLHGQYTRR